MRRLLPVKQLSLLMLLAILPAGALAQATTTCRNVPYVGVVCETQPDWRESLPPTNRAPQQQQPQGIDFGALQRGQQQAEDANYRNLQLQELQMENARRQREAAEMYAGQVRESQYDDNADIYLSSIPNSRNQAIAGGMTPSDFWNRTYSQMLADQTFQAMPQQLQDLVVAKFKRLHDRLETKF